MGGRRDYGWLGGGWGWSAWLQLRLARLTAREKLKMYKCIEKEDKLNTHVYSIKLCVKFMITEHKIAIPVKADM